MLRRAALLSPLVAVVLATSCFGGSKPVPGEEDAFDALAALPRIRSYVGDQAELIELTWTHVKADGTLDLDADYPASARYELRRPSDSDKPVGAGGGAFETVHVRVLRPGMRSVSSGGVRSTYYNRGVTFTVIPSVKSGEPLGKPACTVKDIWARAVAAGAPADAVATVRWNDRGFAFSIPGTEHRLRLDPACQPR